MRRFGIVGACLAVVLAFVAVSAANAVAAEPALYECHKEAKGHGKYAKGCKVEKAGGGYEIKEGIAKGKPFKGKGKGANLNIAGVGGIDCSASSNTGKFTSPTTAGDVVATFKGCELNGKKCESGSVVGEVVTNPLKGGVGYLTGKGTKTPIVGVDISAETGEVLGSAHCGALTFAVTGSVIGEAEPVNKWSKTATFRFKQSSKIGEQEWTHLEGGPTDTLLAHVCEVEGCNPFTAETGFTASAAEETTVVNKGEELMLKA